MAPLEQREVERDLEAEGVEQRQRGDHDVVLSHLVYGPRLAEAGDQVAVREHDALRQARCAARPRQERDIGGTDANGRNLGVYFRSQRSKRNRARRRPVRCAEDEGLANAGGDRAQTHLLLEQLDAGHQPARPCLAQQLRDLLAPEGRIQGGEGGTVDAAYHATTNSMLLGAHNATTSPGCTP